MLWAQGPKYDYMTENETTDSKEMYQHAAVPERSEG
jgi:hypothetical protein